MIHTPATFLAMTGAAFVLASYAPAALEARVPLVKDRLSLSASVGPGVSIPQDRLPTAASVTGKGDRLTAPRPAPRAQSSVAAVEIVGLTQATVILRDRDGAVLYRSDPLSSTTEVAKGADLPLVTLKEAPSAPVVQQAPSAPEPSSVQGLSPKREGQEAPNGGERRPRTIGCETAVSPLVRGAQQAPGRCLAQASAPSAS